MRLKVNDLAQSDIHAPPFVGRVQPYMTTKKLLGVNFWFLQFEKNVIFSYSQIVSCYFNIYLRK